VLETFENKPEVALQATLYDGNQNPKAYHEAKLIAEWLKWWDAMCTEFSNMHSKQVWTIIPGNTIPKIKKIIGNRLVFAQKENGRFRTRSHCSTT
jgi:hypothetical protein